MVKHFVILALVISLFPVDSHAARIGRVKVDDAIVYSAPDDEAEVITELSKGTRLKTSNRAKRGFYKVKTADGTIGWMKASDLRVRKGKRPRRKKKVKKESVFEQNLREAEDSSSSTAEQWRARLFFGFASFGLAEVEAQTGVADITNGIYIGGAIYYRLSDQFYLVLNAERITKGLDVVDSGTSNTFVFDITSLPITTGVEWQYYSSSSFSVSATGLVGMGIGSQLKSTATSFSAPNETIYSGTPIVIVLKKNFAWKFTKTFGVVVDIGYRILKVSSSTPSTSQNGSSLFNSGGSPASLPLDLSGIFYGIGVQVAF